MGYEENYYCYHSFVEVNFSLMKILFKFQNYFNYYYSIDLNLICIIHFTRALLESIQELYLK